MCKTIDLVAQKIKLEDNYQVKTLKDYKEKSSFQWLQCDVTLPSNIFLKKM